LVKLARSTLVITTKTKIEIIPHRDVTKQINLI